MAPYSRHGSGLIWLPQPATSGAAPTTSVVLFHPCHCNLHPGFYAIQSPSPTTYTRRPSLIRALRCRRQSFSLLPMLLAVRHRHSTPNQRSSLIRALRCCRQSFSLLPLLLAVRCRHSAPSQRFVHLLLPSSAPFEKKKKKSGEEKAVQVDHFTRRSDLVRRSDNRPSGLIFHFMFWL